MCNESTSGLATDEVGDIGEAKYDGESWTLWQELRTDSDEIAWATAGSSNGQPLSSAIAGGGVMSGGRRGVVASALSRSMLARTLMAPSAMVSGLEMLSMLCHEVRCGDRMASGDRSNMLDAAYDGPETDEDRLDAARDIGYAVSKLSSVVGDETRVLRLLGRHRARFENREPSRVAMPPNAVSGCLLSNEKRRLNSRS